MKLLTKYRRYTYTSLILVIMTGFLANYFIFKHSSHQSADELIEGYYNDIMDYAQEHDSLQPLLNVNSKFGHITKIENPELLTPIDEAINDTLAYDAYQDEMVIFRRKHFFVEAKDGTYLVKLMLPTIELDILLRSAALSLLVFTVLFILFTSIIDYSITRQIFRPFYKILATIKNYDLEERNEVKLSVSDIDEFNELNRILYEMTQKINHGYLEMKDFLEFTSHELQTPLSVIQLKLDMMSQLSGDNMELLNCASSMQKSLKRAIRFNRSILFIAKIKNNQYAQTSTINLRILFDNCMKQFDEMLSMRDIIVEKEKEGEFRVNLHPLLAEHLVQNILINAIKHNYDGGHIVIFSSANKLNIRNTYKGELPKGDLFEKYNHSADKIDSSGLGMAIVKTICQKNNIGIHYEVYEGEFIVTLHLD